MTTTDEFDELAQRLVIALRDHADDLRALPDVAEMRARLEASAVPSTRASRRVLAAVACSVLVLGAGLAAARRGAGGGGGDEAATLVADESIVAAARPVTSSGEPIETPTTTAAVAPPPTEPPPPVAPSAPPSSAEEVAAPARNELPVAPPTTSPPPATTENPVPAATAPASTTSVAPPTTKPKPTTTTLKTTTTTTTTLVTPFTMTQKWKTSSASPPFEEFAGTAKPGATITITSSYGGGTTNVDPAGKWSLRVEFPNAPLSVSFTGKVATAQGQKSFTFKRV